MSETKYLVSIIVPVYNAEKFLPGTIKSVQNQTVGFEKIQLILVDDCSKDSSYKMMADFASGKENVKVLRTPQGSGSASMPRNIGMLAAEADYIMFLDSDDALRSNAVEVLTRLASEKKTDLVDAAFKNSNEKAPAERRYVGRREGLYDVEKDALELFEISHPIFTKLYKKSIILDNNITFDAALRNGEDSVFLFEYLLHCESMWHENTVIYDYSVREDSVSHDYNSRYFLGLVDTCYSMREKFVGTRIQPIVNRFLEEIVAASIDILCDTVKIEKEEATDILVKWYPHLQFIADNNLKPMVPIVDILLRDVKRNDVDSMIDDFFSMRKLYEERARLTNQILSSRGWKIINAVNRLLGRG